MEVTTAVWLVSILVTGVLSFLGWLLRERFKKLDEVDTRLTRVEMRLDVLGDINATLHRLRTDVEIIKVKVETLPSNK